MKFPRLKSFSFRHDCSEIVESLNRFYEGSSHLYAPKSDICVLMRKATPLTEASILVMPNSELKKPIVEMRAVDGKSIAEVEQVAEMLSLFTQMGPLFKDFLVQYREVVRQYVFARQECLMMADNLSWSEADLTKLVYKACDLRFKYRNEIIEYHKSVEKGEKIARPDTNELLEDLTDLILYPVMGLWWPFDEEDELPRVEYMPPERAMKKIHEIEAEWEKTHLSSTPTV